jgi:hypothetical protein
MKTIQWRLDWERWNRRWEENLKSKGKNKNKLRSRTLMKTIKDMMNTNHLNISSKQCKKTKRFKKRFKKRFLKKRVVSCQWEICMELQTLTKSRIPSFSKNSSQRKATKMRFWRKCPQNNQSNKPLKWNPPKIQQRRESNGSSHLLKKY